MDIEIKIDDSRLMAALDRLAARAGNLSPILKEIAGLLHHEAEEAFEREADPATGTPWPDLAPATRKRREKKGTWPGKILQVTGRLAASIQAQHGPNFALAGTNLEYAKIHQFGGSITQYAHSREVFHRVDERTGEFRPGFVSRRRANFSQWAEVPEHDLTLPARPFLGLSPEGLLKS